MKRDYSVCGYSWVSIDKLLFQGRKVTENIDFELKQDKDFYLLDLMVSDGKLMIQQVTVGCDKTPT